MNSNREKNEFGGHIFPGARYAPLVAVYLHQVVLICILILKSTTRQAVITFLMTLFTLGYTMYCHKQYYRIVQNSSMHFYAEKLGFDDEVFHLEAIHELGFDVVEC